MLSLIGLEDVQRVMTGELFLWEVLWEQLKKVCQIFPSARTTVLLPIFIIITISGKPENSWEPEPLVLSALMDMSRQEIHMLWIRVHWSLVR